MPHPWVKYGSLRQAGENAQLSAHLTASCAAGRPIPADVQEIRDPTEQQASVPEVPVPLHRLFFIPGL
jgi:hypothetical protein